MEQHPVPQNVTTFQFRLIGDMTLKQFGYLCAGAILAYISYKLPLPFFFAWPLTVFFALLGIGFAFVPVEERPMDVWVLSFFKSIYSPTQYIWSRSVTAPQSKVTPPAPSFPPEPQKPQVPATQPPPDQKDKDAQRVRLLDLQQQLTKLLTEKSVMEEELIRLRRAAPTQVVAPPTKNAGDTIKIITPQTATKSGLPRLTTFPNVVTGIVKDTAGNLLPSVLVTVRDTDGVPLRAFKTNRLGQFAASTPLPPGTYLVEVEDPRDRYVFDRAQIVVNNTLIPAIEVIAKSQKELERAKLAQQIFGNTQ